MAGTAAFDPIRKSGSIDSTAWHQYNQRPCLLQTQTHRMADERVQRRLAAILAADVVGYSSLMEQDEAGTLAALKERRKQVLTPVWSKKLSEAPGPFTPLRDGSNARAHPVSRGFAQVLHDKCPY